MYVITNPSCWPKQLYDTTATCVIVTKIAAALQVKTSNVFISKTILYFDPSSGFHCFGKGLLPQGKQSISYTKVGRVSMHDQPWKSYPMERLLTHWGRVTHICVSKLTIIGSDNGLSPDRRQAIIWTNAGLLLIEPLGTTVSEILIKILTFSFKKKSLKVSSAKRRPFCLGLNVLTNFTWMTFYCLWNEHKITWKI